MSTEVLFYLTTIAVVVILGLVIFLQHRTIKDLSDAVIVAYRDHAIMTGAVNAAKEGDPSAYHDMLRKWSGPRFPPAEHPGPVVESGIIPEGPRLEILHGDEV